MSKSNISLGQINFTNCIPINYSISKLKLNRLKVYNGCPSEINKMMKDNIVDIAPISSIEYLNNQDKYTLVDNICISSTGKVASVILFSNYEMNQLSGKEIALPFSSASSIALLKVLLSENQVDLDSIKFSVHKYEVPLEEFLAGKCDAILYIGDYALFENIKSENKYYTYDLGECWFNMTNLPMVFGTWAVNSAWMRNNIDDFHLVKNVLYKAVETGLSLYFNEIINLTYDKLKIDKTHIKDYLTNKIRYKFTEDHNKSLMLFEKLHNKLNKSAEIKKELS